jgi:hypothetical protein
MFYSCHKNEETTVTKEIPPWLQLKVAALVPEPALCEITEITFIQYNGKNYFHVYCGIWSCMYCQLFDEQGKTEPAITSAYATPNIAGASEASWHCGAVSG